MKVTYLSHSGFCVELETMNLLFDYYEGKIPVFDNNKKVFIFVSHKHADHYSWKIWDIRKQHPNVCYVISKDIPFSENARNRHGITNEDEKRILRAYGNKQYEWEELNIITLKSTDEGVAYVVLAEGKYIYHAGDLNLWAWQGEPDEYNEKMKRNYCGQIDKIKDISFELAFVPLDSRQEVYAYGGMDYFLEKVNAKHVFPMHMWKQYQMILQYKKDRQGKLPVEVIGEIGEEGQSFEW